MYEELSSLVDNVVTSAHELGYNPDDVMKMAVGILSTMIEVSTFKNYKKNDVQVDRKVVINNGE